VEATAPLANVGRGNIGLGHAVQRTLDDIYRVVVLVWILFVIDVGKHAVGRRILLISQFLWVLKIVVIVRTHAAVQRPGL